jgi:hypothetical protein
MKTKMLVLLNHKILFLTIGCLAGFLCLASAYNLDEYYPLNQGNTWQYSIVSDRKVFEVIVRIEGEEVINGVKTVKRILSEETSCEHKYQYMVIDSEGIKIYKNSNTNGYTVFSPPIVISNIEIGESKTGSVNGMVYNDRGTVENEELNYRIKLESTEDVKVPAGSFPGCLRFSFANNWKVANGDYGAGDCTMWFAQGVGEVKKFCIITEYIAKTKKESIATELYQLISAVIDGNKIHSQ